MGLLGIDDFAKGLNDLGHGIGEGVGDLVDNTSEAAGGWLENGGSALDQALPGPDIYGDLGGFGSDALDLGGNIAETTIDLGNMVTGIGLDSAVVGLDGLGNFVDWGNESLSGAGDLANGLLNGDFGAFNDWASAQEDLNRGFADDIVDTALDGPLGPEQFTENYLENDFFDLTDEGKSWGEQAHELTDGFFDDNSWLFEPPIHAALNPGEYADRVMDSIQSQMGSGGGDSSGGGGGGVFGGIGGVLGGIFGGGGGNGGGSWEGMNVEAVEAAARQLQEQSQRIVKLIAKVDGEVSDLASNWHGDDAQRFVQEWQGQYKAVLNKAAQLLEQLSGDALKQVGQQKATSGN